MLKSAPNRKTRFKRLLADRWNSVDPLLVVALSYIIYMRLSIA